MPSRRVIWQWDQAGVLRALEKLDRFIRLADLDDELGALDQAIERFGVGEGLALEYRTARELARSLLRNGRRLWEIERVVARKGGTEVWIEIEYGDSVVEPLLTT